MQIQEKCISGILPASNITNKEFTSYFHEGDFDSLPALLFTDETVSAFYLHCLGLGSSLNIILQHVFPPTSQCLNVRALQGQLSRLQTQPSFRCRGHLSLWMGISMCTACNHGTGIAALSLCRRWRSIYPVVNCLGYRHKNCVGRSLWYS